MKQITISDETFYSLVALHHELDENRRGKQVRVNGRGIESIEVNDLLELARAAYEVSL